jgi:hypothetical protein
MNVMKGHAVANGVCCCGKLELEQYLPDTAGIEFGEPPS